MVGENHVELQYADKLLQNYCIYEAVTVYVVCVYRMEDKVLQNTDKMRKTDLHKQLQELFKSGIHTAQ